MAKLFTFEEVWKHHAQKDCWIVISGKVYDVSQFMNKHPGGEDIMLSTIGIDAKEDFEGVGHSDSARDQMAQFYIGEIDPSSIVQCSKSVYTPSDQANYNHDKTPETVIKILQFLALMILGLAFVVRKYAQKE